MSKQWWWGGNLQPVSGFPVKTYGENATKRLDTTKNYVWFGCYGRSKTVFYLSHGTIIDGVLTIWHEEKGSFWSTPIYDPSTGDFTFGPGHSDTPAVMMVFEVS